MEPHEIEIRHGLDAHQLPEAAAILYEAFERKLRPFLRSRDDAVPVIQAVLRREQVMAALRMGTVVGICGLSYRGQRYLVRASRPFTHQFGLLGGMARFWALHFFKEPLRKNELLINAVAVRADMRGRGIGTQMLLASRTFAQSLGLHALRLSVVDTNPDARRLYERLGFQHMRTSRFPLLRRLKGFSAVTSMRWPVAERIP